MGAAAIVETLEHLPTLTPTPQPENGITYAHKIDKAEAAIDWTRPAIEIDRQIRGLSPFPGAWTLIGRDRVKCLASETADGQGEPGTTLDNALTVACGRGAVRILRAQRAGRGAQQAAEFLRGTPVPKGTKLGE